MGDLRLIWGKKLNFWMGLLEEATGLCELLLASSLAMEATSSRSELLGQHAELGETQKQDDG